MPSQNNQSKKPQNPSKRSGGQNSKRPNTSKGKKYPSGGKGKHSGTRQKNRGTTSNRSGGAPRKYKNKNTPSGKEVLDPIPGNKEWGGLARKGVLRVHHDDQKDLEKVEEVDELKDELTPEDLELQQERERKKEERIRRQEELRIEAKAALDRAKRVAPKSNKSTPKAHKRKPIARGAHRYSELQPRFKKAYGHNRVQKNLKLFNEASKAFEEERFDDALRKIRPLTKSKHGIPEIHELFGLIMYRRGEYVNASTSLEVFRSQASSTELHPVLMDCYRAEDRWNDIEFLWDELREISPSGAIVAEGRIVMAGSLADRGELEMAVKLLEKGWKAPKRPKDHHLRIAYALADLYDRAGNIPRAREIFAWIVKFAPGFVDARERLKNLR